MLARIVDRLTALVRQYCRHLQIVVAIGLTTALLQHIDVSALADALGTSDWRYAPMVLTLIFVDRYLMSFKWALLLRARGVKLSFARAFRIYLLAGFAGTFLPTSVGADVVKLARTTIAVGELNNVTASIIMERALGLTALVLVTVAGLAFLAAVGEKRLMPLLFIASLVLASLVVALALSFSKTVTERVKTILVKLRRYRIAQLLLGTQVAYAELGARRKVLTIFVALSLLEHGILSLQTFIGAVALGFDLRFLYFVALIPVTTLVGLLPISIGGLGVTEGAFVVLFSLVGLSGAEALALAVYMRAVGLVSLVPGGLIFAQDVAALKCPEAANRG